jgi:hypothetical protein
MMKMYRIQCVFNDSGVSHALRSTKEIMEIFRNDMLSMILELPTLSVPPKK